MDSLGEGDAGASVLSGAGATQAGVRAVADWRYRLAVWAAIAATALAAHGWTIFSGFTLDDHLQDQYLSRAHWSAADFLEATTIDPKSFVELWWQNKPVHLQFVRPFAVLLMKVSHDLSGGSPVAQHVVSVGLHILGALLVHSLCLLLTRNRFWSVVGALLFVVYAHSVFAVGWLAAQNAVLQTVLMLASLLCYIRASRLNVGPQPAVGFAGGGVATAPRMRAGMFAVAVLLWVAALLSRENAIMLPAIFVAFDVAFGGWNHARARLGAYALVGAVAACFLVCRLGLYYYPLPDVYVQRPDGAGYAAWALAKLMHYLCAAIWLSPMLVGPSGRRHPFVEVPGDCLLMAGILVVLGISYYLACRRIRGWWIWPLWLLLAVLPMVPVMATPHTGYLCGVAFAVGTVLCAGAGEGLAGRRVHRAAKIVAVWFLAVTCGYIPVYINLWRSVIAADKVPLQALARLEPPRGATDLFFINLPFPDIYVKTCLDEAWKDQVGDVRCHVLTFAPSILGMEQPYVLEQIDDRRFSISIVDKPYFSGFLGRLLIDGMRNGGPLKVNDEVRGDLFDVRVLDADERGVHQLLFAFHEPLESRSYRFYASSQECGLVPLRFQRSSPAETAQLAPPVVPVAARAIEAAAEKLRAGDRQAAEVLLSAAAGGDSATRMQAWDSFRETAAPVVAAAGSPVSLDLAITDPSMGQLERVAAWWRDYVDDALIEQVWRGRSEQRNLMRERDRVLRFRRHAASIIRTDLYFTGPPYPGPGQ